MDDIIGSCKSIGTCKVCQMCLLIKACSGWDKYVHYDSILYTHYIISVLSVLCIVYCCDNCWSVTLLPEQKEQEEEVQRLLLSRVLSRICKGGSQLNNWVPSAGPTFFQFSWFSSFYFSQGMSQIYQANRARIRKCCCMHNMWWWSDRNSCIWLFISDGSSRCDIWRRDPTCHECHQGEVCWRK